MSAQGYGLDDKVNKSGDTMTGTLTLDGSPPLKIPAGAASGLALTSDGSGDGSWGPVSGQFLCTPSQYAPGTRATPNTTSGTMAAVDSTNITTGSFTAPPSGEVLVTASLVAAVGSGTGRCAFSVAAHGTVSPVLAEEWTPVVGTNLEPYTFRMPVTGLTPGNSYNLDLLFASLDGATLTVYAVGQTSTTPATSGGPVLMTVQAV